MNRLKELIFIFIIALPGFSNLGAQQLSHFSLASMNKFQFNPAVSVFDNTLVVSALHRNQWTDIAGSPSSQLLNAYMPLDFGVSAVGFQLSNDAIGVERSLSFSFSYAHMFDYEWGSLSFGVLGGGEQKKFDQSALRTPGGNYGDDQINHMDPILNDKNLNSWIPVFGISSWVAFRGFEGGVSLRQLSPMKHFSDEPFSYQVQAEYSFFIDYFLVLDEGLFFIPSFHVYTDLKKAQTWLHGMFGLNNQYFAGMGVRGYSPSSFDAIGLSAGMRLSDHFVFYYNYDIGLSEIYNAAGSTHELMVVYRMPEWRVGRQLPQIIYNPRFLE